MADWRKEKDSEVEKEGAVADGEVMSIIDNAKEVADLIKAAENTEHYRKIVELEGEIIELTRQNRKLEETVEEQKSLLALKEKMIWKNPFYVIEG